MSQQIVQQLRGLTTFPTIFVYLRDALDWPLDSENFQEEDVTFEYTSADLGLAKKHAAKVEGIRQLRPLERDQPWAVFYIEFDDKHLPVTVLRSILRRLTKVREDRPGWDMEDLLFITMQGTAANRSIAFSHFRRGDNHRLPELRTFGWDGDETHFYYIQNLNLENLRWRKRGESVSAWRDRWREAFISRPSVVITESRQLATAMAGQARFMRDAILETYALEHPNGIWHSLMNEVQIELIHDLSERGFADVIAQTITYGLFSAAEQNPSFTLADFVTAIPPTNPFLRDLLTKLIEEPRIDLIALGIDRLISLYRDANVPEIAQQFMRRTASGSEDPVILFYEQFLSEYDREQRVQHGVFYTPDPMVHYIVHSVDSILQEEFDIPDGLASAEKHANGEHRVQILDPATGTGTFLAHIIDLVHDAKRSMTKAQWNEYVAADLLPRLNGFELMMAPYTIAHMKLGLKLEQTGYEFQSDQRLRVFLTNALNAPTQSIEVLGKNFLAREADEAAKVKKLRKIMVVIGNPPYSGHSANNGEYIRDLLRGKLPNGKKVANYFEVDGEPLNERSAKWLSDDYVKFIRMGQQRIEETGYGVLAFITNNGYLDNPTFRGMRQSLMQTFDALYLLDLHGNARKKEKTPDGGKDENVFDIMQGVSIGLFVKGGKHKGTFKADLWGLREHKYRALGSDAVSRTDFKPLEIHAPSYLFTEQDRALRDEYFAYISTTELMKVGVLGFQSHRDNFAIDFDRAAIDERIQDMRSSTIDDASFRQKYGVTDNRDWQLTRVRRAVRDDKDWERKLILCDYRPLDQRYCYFSEIAMDYPRRELIQHVAGKPNLCLNTMRQTKMDRWQHALVSAHPTPAVFVEVKDGSSVFPLYLYPSTRELFDVSEWELSEKGRRPNLDKAMVEDFAARLELRFITDGRGDLVNTFGPEDIFHYAYALFYSPTYRTRYVAFLKRDFPRLPLTDNLVLFNQLVQRGADLVAFHLLDDAYVAASWVLDGDESPLVETGVRFMQGKDGTTVGRFGNNNYDEQHGRVYLDNGKRPDTSYFDGITQDVWEFQVGGYQVLHKWLYDRRANNDQAGRTLTTEEIEHYKRIVASLRQTMQLMEDIDKIIDSHGGYPIVGSQAIEEGVAMTDFPKRDKDLFGYRGDQLGLGDAVPASDDGQSYETIADWTEPEDTGNSQMEPFNPDDIDIDTKQFTLDLILARIRRSYAKEEQMDQKTADGINLSPAFQRKAGIWDNRKKSRLIESLFLRIPLPAFYVAEDPVISNHWIVVDGLQRLTTLKEFAIDKSLALHELEFWGLDLNNKTWDTIPESLQVRISETQVVVHIIKRRTPEAVRFNVFKRINTGGVPLSAQEIRHALNQGAITVFLEQLAGTPEFLSATDNGVSPQRQTDRECVLRFIAFSEVSYQRYSDKDSLDTFFNSIMKAMNRPENVARYPAIEARLKRAMVAAREIFGNKAFRKTLSGNRRSPISKALFEVWSVVLDSLNDDQLVALKDKRAELIKQYEALQSDQDFAVAISYSTGNTKRVRDRFSKIENIVNKVLDSEHA